MRVGMAAGIVEQRPAAAADISRSDQANSGGMRMKRESRKLGRSRIGVAALCLAGFAFRPGNPETASPMNNTWSCQRSRRQGCNGTVIDFA